MATRQYIVSPGVYVCETSATRSEILAPGVFVNETSAAVKYAAFVTPQDDGVVLTKMTAY